MKQTQTAAVRPQSTAGDSPGDFQRPLTWALAAALTLIVTSSTSAQQGLAYVALTSDGRLKQRPHWSPDGRSLVFARHAAASIRLYILDVASGKERRLSEQDQPMYDAVWSPDGKRLAFTFDKTSPNQGDLEVNLIDADGQNQQPLAFTQGKLSHEESPAWSPDGQRVAFTSTRDGNQELYSIGSDGKDRRRLTSDPAIDAHPRWSPDGRRLAFATNRWGDLEIAVLEIATGTVTRLTQHRGLDDYPAWSPDGRRIAFTRNLRGNFEIFTIDADGANARNETQNAAIDNFPAWTPDGRLTLVSNRGRGFEIYVRPGKKKQQ